MRHLFACLAVIAFAASADACINDVELPSHEREFRSQYQGPAAVISNPADAAPQKEPDYRPWYGAGLVLLTGALALSWTARRLRS